MAVASISWCPEARTLVMERVRAEAGEGGEDPALGGLMSAYQRGEAEAFDRLYSLLAPDLRRYFLATARDPEIADDLVQETFLRVHQARRSYDPSLPLRPWLFAIARYVQLGDRRSRQRRARREVVGLEAGGEPAGPGAADALMGRHLLGQLLPRVPRHRRLPLLLHHLLGLDFQEIGRRLGLSAGAARVRAHRALAELRKEEPREGPPTEEKEP